MTSRRPILPADLLGGVIAGALLASHAFRLVGGLTGAGAAAGAFALVFGIVLLARDRPPPPGPPGPPAQGPGQQSG